MPQIRILVNGNLVPSIMRTENEVVVISAPLSYGEVVMFECQASTETFTSSITINLTYSCKSTAIDIRYTESEFVAIAT